MTIRQFETHRPTLHETVYVDESALVLGRVSLGENSSVWPNATIRGDIHDITIGERTNIQDGAVLHVTHDSRFAPGGSALLIGDDVTVGHNVTLHGCSIGNQCLIGMNAVVLDGAVIQDQVMVAANALVTPNKILESGYLYGGSPATQMRPLTDKECEFLEYSAEHYALLKERHRRASVKID